MATVAKWRRRSARSKRCFPADGWVEQDPEALWRSVLATAREAIAESGLASRQIEAIGIVNQRETTLAWDAHTGVALGNAIVWQDRRTAAQCQRIRDEGVEPEIAAITGLLADPYFSSTKIKWLLDQGDLDSAAARGDVRFGTVGQFPGLAAHQGWPPRHGRDQRSAHTAIRHRPAGVERSAAGLLRYCAGGAADGARLLRRFRRRGCRMVRRADPHPRRGGRPAGGAARPGVSRAGNGQEHVRNRVFRDRQHRPGAGAIEPTPAHHGGLSRERHNHVCLGGQHFQCRRGHQVAARHAGPDRVLGGHGARGAAHRGRHRRRLRRPGVHRSRRPALATRCPRV